VNLAVLTHLTSKQWLLNGFEFAWAGRLPLRQNFRFGIQDSFRVIWKGFFHLGEEPRFQFQTCNLIGKSKTLMAQEAS